MGCVKCGKKLDTGNSVDGLWKRIKIENDNMCFGERIYRYEYSFCSKCGEGFNNIIYKYIHGHDKKNIAFVISIKEKE